MQTQTLLNLITALEALTTVNSITPQYLGNILREIANQLQQADDEKADIEHAADTGRYGKASATQFGHVILKDDSVNASLMNASIGVAVTPYLLWRTRQDIEALITALGNRLTNHIDNGVEQEIETHNIFVKTRNETVTGNTNFQGTVTVIAPTSNLHAATKKYVDDKVSDKLSKTNTSAQSVGGPISFSKAVTLKTEGTADNHAVTKAYVDAMGDCHRAYDNILRRYTFQGAAASNKRFYITGMFSCMRSFTTSDNLILTRLSFTTRNDSNGVSMADNYKGPVYVRIAEVLTGTILFRSTNYVQATGQANQKMYFDLEPVSNAVAERDQRLALLFSSTKTGPVLNVVKLGVGITTTTDTDFATIEPSITSTTGQITMNSIATSAHHDGEMLADFFLDFNVQMDFVPKTSNGLVKVPLHFLESTQCLYPSLSTEVANKEYVDDVAAQIRGVEHFDEVINYNVTLIQSSYIPNSSGMNGIERIAYVVPQKRFVFHAGLNYYAGWPTYKHYMIENLVLSTKFYVCQGVIYYVDPLTCELKNYLADQLQTVQTEISQIKARLGMS